MQCLTIAMEHPPAAGEYRVFNQFEEVYDITQLAEKVQRAAQDLGLAAEIRNIENPRIEKEEHYYNPDHRHLLDLGYAPTHDIDAEIRVTLQDLMKYTDRIVSRKQALMPDVHWDGTRKKVKYLPTGVRS